MNMTIQTRNLSKGFDDFQLGPLNIKVAPGEILGVMGPNGAGKTTLLRLLWGFLRPDSGEATIFGLQPHLDQLKIRLRAGYLPENPRFYDAMSAMSFLQFIGNFYETWDRDRTDRLLAEFEIQSDQPIRNLSKGNRAKLAIIAATGHWPGLLILDEPTSGLDPLIRVDILGFLRRLAKHDKTSIVLSSHISDDLDRLADTVLMLNAGQPVEYAPAAVLHTKYNLDRLEAIFLDALGTQHHS